ncbi:Adenylate kinase [Rhodococcus sp. RD6.2]|jgi:adenylate kinase|uniref:adenylate kinase n=1 Tax=Rhodococcus sp. RD6.2 TaxID=260936 RepID=UPI00063BCD73|nr:adenylate kinase [Rhodococcus sp. RD6.2]CRK52799.1 Adenylate kinase [Rhodococcus sp. RD6.2]
MRIILIGPPGVGKGTQSSLLARTLKIPHISTGDLFRWHIANSSTLGKAVKAHIDAGELVPDSITELIVAEGLSRDDAAAGFILDGFPRTHDQARVLDAILETRGDKVDHVIEFTLDNADLASRLLARGRSDDTDDVIRRRLDVYVQERAAILGHYGPIVTELDASGSVEEIGERLLSALGARILQSLGVRSARSGHTVGG